MKSVNALVATSTLLLGLAAAQNDQADATNCTSGAHIIVARASGEAAGYGILKLVKDELLAQIPNSNAVAVPYPATINLGGEDGVPFYTESVPYGVGNMTKLVQDYGDACPDGRMVLMGYSQGAHVVGNVLLGNTDTNFALNPPLDEKYLPQIVAVVMMGDPAFVLDQPVDVGNATKGGLFARDNNDWVARGLADKTKSYCDFNDTYCDRGMSLAVHVGYVTEYGNQSVEFVVGKFENSSSGGGEEEGPTPSPSSSADPAASPTPSQYTGGVERLSAGYSAAMVMGALAAVFAYAL